MLRNIAFHSKEKKKSYFLSLIFFQAYRCLKVVYSRKICPPRRHELRAVDSNYMNGAPRKSIDSEQIFPSKC